MPISQSSHFLQYSQYVLDILWMSKLPSVEQSLERQLEDSPTSPHQHMHKQMALFIILNIFCFKMYIVKALQPKVTQLYVTMI